MGLFILTVVATVFTPLTFVAGVYGMNFQDENKNPTIPELLNPNGYLYFWVTSIVYLLICVPAGIFMWRRIYGRKRACPASCGKTAMLGTNDVPLQTCED